MKNFIKKFFRNDIVQKIIAYIFHFYIYFVYKTSKIIIKGPLNEVQDYIKLNKGIVLFTWHGRMLIAGIGLNSVFRKEIDNGIKIAVLSSFHRDGKIASHIMKTFNIGVIEGSSINPKKGSTKNKKSLTAIRQILKTLHDGSMVILAADGPRGPAHKMNTKITDLVQKADTSIVSVSISAKYKKELKTWDKFQIFFPFNKIIVEFGSIMAPKNFNGTQELNIILEDQINNNMEKNDNIL